MGAGTAGSPQWPQSPTVPSALVLLVVAAGADGLRGTGAVAAQTWTTQPDYRIDAPGDGASGFGRGSYLRVGPDGTRIVVLDSEPVDYTATVWRILVFSPDGGPVLHMGPDDFPADPGAPWDVRAGESGFRVKHRDRAAWYSYSGGSPGETVVLPRGFAHTISVVGGGFLALADVPIGHSGGQAVLSVADADGARTPDTVGVLDTRNSILSITLGDPRDPRQGSTTRYSGQDFADNDRWWMDAETGSIGIVRMNGPPGVAEVFEILATGDTAWHRLLSLPTVPLSTERAERAVADKVDGVRADAERYGLTAAQLRSLVEDALHVPSHLPLVSAVVPTASREVWLKTRRVEDGLAVWYAIGRGDGEHAPRRVLVPTSFRLNDAFGDHVWGFSRSTSEPVRILGLRLVPRSP